MSRHHEDGQGWVRCADVQDQVHALPVGEEGVQEHCVLRVLGQGLPRFGEGRGLDDGESDLLEEGREADPDHLLVVHDENSLCPLAPIVVHRWDECITNPGLCPPVKIGNGRRRELVDGLHRNTPSDLRGEPAGDDLAQPVIGNGFCQEVVRAVLLDDLDALALLLVEARHDDHLNVLGVGVVLDGPA